MKLPRARQEGLIIKELDGEILVYDRTRYKTHCLNHTAATVWRYCDGQSSVSDIARRPGKDFGSVIDEEFVWIALKQLTASKLLDEAVELPAGTGNLWHRQMMKIGLGAALAVPLIASIVSPTATNLRGVRLYVSIVRLLA